METENLDLITGGGAAGDELRAFDWQATALGPLAAWSVEQRCAVNMVLNMDLPAVLAWGRKTPVICACNNAYKPILGAKSPVLGVPYVDLWPEVSELAHALVDQALEGRTQFYQDQPMRVRRRGFLEDCCFSFGVSPVFDARARVAGIMLIVLETTDKVDAERRLHETRERFRILVEATAKASWEANLRGEIETVSDSWTEFTGLSEAESKAAGWVRVVHPEDRDDVLSAWRQAIATGQPLDCEYRMKTASKGLRWVAARAAPILDYQGKIIKWVGMNFDIHDHKRTENALETELRQKNHFIAVLSHELRNPLSAISASLDLLKSEPDEQIRQNSHKLIRRQMNHLTRLVDDLMDTARIDNAHLNIRLQAVRLVDVLTSATDEVRHLFEREGGELELRLPRQDIWLQGDPDRLAQVFVNLLANAARYAKDDGGRVRLTARLEADRVEVSVTDNGAGVAASERERIFGMFQRGENDQGEGLGIGLSLARQLVEAHGGRIRIRSEGRHAGAEFVVSLVTRQAPESAEAAVGQDERSGDQPCAEPGLRVLLVEDNPDVAEAMSNVLHMLGHELRWADTGAQAITDFALFDPQVVLLDIGLPDINGYEVARRIRLLPAGEQARFIVLTGWGEPSSQANSQSNPPDERFLQHMTKPVNIDCLETLLNGVAEEVALKGH